MSKKLDEDILLKYNMYYERRVNFYKNQGYLICIYQQQLHI